MWQEYPGLWMLEQIVIDLEIYHNITTSGGCTEDFYGNWYGIGMEFCVNKGPTGITLEWTF